MPKNRKMTYSDRQAEASRQKKLAAKTPEAKPAATPPAKNSKPK